MEPVQWCFGELSLTWFRDTLIVSQYALLSLSCFSVVLSLTLCSLVRFAKQISTGISFRKLHPRFYETDLWTSRGMQSSSLAVRLNPVRPVAITFQIPFDLNLKEKNYFQRRKHRNMFSLQCPSKLCEFRTWSWMFTWILTKDWSFRGPYSLSAPSIIWKKNFFCFSKVPSWRFGK